MARTIRIARAGTPEDIAFACGFLCSDKASYVIGQEINVTAARGCKIAGAERKRLAHSAEFLPCQVV